jgi:hypothetical protein
VDAIVTQPIMLPQPAGSRSLVRVLARRPRRRPSERLPR